jgi:hypothetical protein
MIGSNTGWSSCGTIRFCSAYCMFHAEYMDLMVKGAVEIQLCHSNLNRDGGLSVSQSWDLVSGILQSRFLNSIYYVGGENRFQNVTNFIQSCHLCLYYYYYWSN